MKLSGSLGSTTMTNTASDDLFDLDNWSFPVFLNVLKACEPFVVIYALSASRQKCAKSRRISKLRVIFRRTKFIPA